MSAAFQRQLNQRIVDDRELALSGAAVIGMHHAQAGSVA
jgi:hypothetical protein